MKKTLKLKQIKYGTDGVYRSWGTAVAWVGEGQDACEIGKVRAVVKLHKGDVFNEKTGRDLIFNVLRRKAIEKALHNAEATYTSLVFETAAIVGLINELDAEKQDLEADFKKL